MGGTGGNAVTACDGIYNSRCPWMWRFSPLLLLSHSLCFKTSLSSCSVWAALPECIVLKVLGHTNVQSNRHIQAKDTQDWQRSYRSNAKILQKHMMLNKLYKIKENGFEVDAWGWSDIPSEGIQFEGTIMICHSSEQRHSVRTETVPGGNAAARINANRLRGQCYTRKQTHVRGVRWPQNTNEQSRFPQPTGM